MLKLPERLRGVDTRLQRVVFLAADNLTFDVQLIEGVRTVERQRELFAQGRNGNPGPVVTWSINSMHIIGRAVDLAPLQADASINWKDARGFDKLAAAMFAAAEVVGVRIRWGADWDMDGNPRERGESDSPHFEIAP